MTPRQLQLARHALGLPNDRRRSYRNRFYAAPGGDDHAQWLQLVASGDALRGPSGRLDFFCLTEQGARRALERGERLDAEDFPALQGAQP